MAHEQDDDSNGAKELTQEQQARIDEWAAMTTPDLVRDFASLRQIKETKEAELKQITWAHDWLRLNTIVQRMEDEGITTITVDGVGRVSLQGDLYARIPADKRALAFEWLRDNGHGDVITETIPAPTLKAMAKELLKKGETLPKDMFKITPFSRAQLTAKKA